jgi:hypothetical protein
VAARWTATADAVRAVAVEAQRAGRRASALAHYRRAATYYPTALQRVSRTSERERHGEIWRRRRECSEPRRRPVRDRRRAASDALGGHHPAGVVLPRARHADGGTAAAGCEQQRRGTARPRRRGCRAARAPPSAGITGWRSTFPASRPPCSSGDPVPPRLRGDASPVLDATPWVGSCAEAPDALTPVAGSTRSRGGRRRNRRRYHMSFRRWNRPSSWLSEVDDGCAHGLPVLASRGASA